MATLYIYFMEFLGAIVVGVILAFFLFVIYYLIHDWKVKKKIPQDVKEKALEEKEKEKVRIQELMKGGFNERKIKEDLHAQEVKRFVEQQGYNADPAASAYSTSVASYNTTSSGTTSGIGGRGQLGKFEDDAEQRRSLSLPSTDINERNSKSSKSNKRNSKRNWNSFS